MKGQPTISGWRKVEVVKANAESAEGEEEEEKPGRCSRQRPDGRSRHGKRIPAEPLGDGDGNIEDLAQDEAEVLKRKKNVEVKAGQGARTRIERRQVEDDHGRETDQLSQFGGEVGLRGTEQGRVNLQD